jgi:hypothetical protein
MKTKAKRELVEKIAAHLRQGNQPTDEHVDEMAAAAVELFGNLLISIDVSLKKIADAAS